MDYHEKIISDGDSKIYSEVLERTYEDCKTPNEIFRHLSILKRTDSLKEHSAPSINAKDACSYTQKDCSKFLPGLEFSSNNHVNDSTKYSSFYLEYG